MLVRESELFIGNETISVLVGVDGWIIVVLIYALLEYYGAAEPPVRCGESHLSGH